MFRTAILTALAVVAFAANSLLCRLALQDGGIDPASFGLIRLASGAIVLAAIRAARRSPPSLKPGWLSAAMLFVYVAAFSFAYVTLSAGTGALLLFGTVQATMLVAAMRAGERPRAAEVSGLVLALAGLVWLVFPGLAAPPLLGSALMAAAGVAWGIYSLVGRGSADPLADTTRNFLYATSFALALSLATLDRAHLGPRGALLAVCSGAVTSGLGYVIWFAALRHLTAIRAATVQLAVPAVAACGGVLFLHEELTVRVVAAAAMILSGVALAGRARTART